MNIDILNKLGVYLKNYHPLKRWDWILRLLKYL